MKDKDILDLWIDTTGYEEDWRTLIEEIIDEIYTIAETFKSKQEEEEEDIFFRRETPETLVQNLKDLLQDLEKKINEAKEGELPRSDLMYIFRKAAEYIERAKELVEVWTYDEPDEYYPEEEEEE
ncbi:MAG: hypothetical protein GXO29_03555 [Thermotogae bacterium]|nr:hypothetical protein [Thermotogota bacterium]